MKILINDCVRGSEKTVDACGMLRVERVVFIDYRMDGRQHHKESRDAWVVVACPRCHEPLHPPTSKTGRFFLPSIDCKKYSKFRLFVLFIKKDENNMACPANFCVHFFWQVVGFFCEKQLKNVAEKSSDLGHFHRHAWKKKKQTCSIWRRKNMKSVLSREIYCKPAKPSMHARPCQVTNSQPCETLRSPS